MITVAEANTPLDTQAPSNILMSDLAMPEVDGYDLIQQVRAAYSASDSLCQRC